MNGVWCVYSSGASVYFPSYQQLVPGGMGWLEAFDSVIPVMCCLASVWICHPLGWMMDTSVCCEEDRRIGWGGGRGRKSPSLCRALGERVESGYKALLGHLLMTQTQLEKLWKKLLKLGRKGNNYGRSNHQTMVKHLVLHATARLSCFFGSLERFGARFPQLLCWSSVRQSPWIQFILWSLTSSRICTSFSPSPCCLL